MLRVPLSKAFLIFTGMGKLVCATSAKIFKRQIACNNIFFMMALLIG
jgi:multidrug transporter EmrE-like cation transporter